MKTMKMPPSQGSQHDFARVPKADIPRSQINKSSSYKTTLDAGYLYPIFAEEVIPGDTHRVNFTGFARMNTAKKPIMDNLYFETHFFFYPDRLGWENFEKFMGAQVNPGDSTSFLVPELEAHNPQTDLIAQYLGVPFVNAAGLKIVAKFHRAYNAIYNQWYRDQNLQNSLPEHKDDGPDPMTSYDLRRRGKRHDYFTSCLPWPQKGTAVGLPAVYVFGNLNQGPTFKNATAVATGKILQFGASAASGSVNFGAGAGSATANTQMLWENPQLYADLGSLTINQIRQAFQVQRYYEADARGGTRYPEKIQAHFRVTSPDGRLQRPEYLGGGSSPITMSAVAQTGATQATTTAQGNLAGVGTMTASQHGFAKSFTEHGVILGICSIRADLSYQQGLNKKWTRRTVLDYPWPTFAHLGEQAVLSKEIFWDGTAADDTVFGYQERYADYRYSPSLVTGKLASTATTPLDVWHLAQKFATRPTLGALFIEENPPISRVVEYPSEPAFILDGYFEHIAARPLPLYSVPGLADHF